VASYAWDRIGVLLLLAATDTAAVPGISAAGATPAARRQTAAADAELLVLGPKAVRPHALPPLPAGVSPALISHAVLRDLDLLGQLQVVDLGCAVAPAIPHLRLPGQESVGPAACLSTGRAMAPERVAALLARGRSWGRAWALRWGCRRPLMVAECVPGGTSTALAVLQALGVEAAGLVSGSLRQPVHQLKSRLVEVGLERAGLGRAAGKRAGLGERGVDAEVDPLAVLAAVGDPMQVLAAGLVLEAGAARVPLLLAGGSQMAAVLALALALAPAAMRPTLAAAASVATTAWVVAEADSDLPRLMELIGERWGCQTHLEAASLRFHGCRSQALRDYEQGFVKEGVGAGGLAVLWQRLGRAPLDLARHCDRLCDELTDAVAGPIGGEP
jgi:uncharacterized protein (TIGR00303 family)